MKLIFLIDHVWTSNAGTENQVFKLLPGLAEHFETELICLRPHSWLADQSAILKSKVTFFKIDNFHSLSSFRNWLAMVRYIRRSRPCIVHTFFPVANIVGVLAARLAGAHAVIASRRDYGEWMSPPYLRATHFANRFLDGIVANSNEVKLLTHRVEGYPLVRIEVIANAIDTAVPRQDVPDLALKRRLGIPEEDAVVLLVANYRPMKRHVTAVKAMPLVLRQIPNVTFLLVGRDFEEGKPSKGRLRLLAVDQGVSEKLRFTDAEGRDIPSYLSIASVGINCSQGEGISNAIMEYMLAGLPVVAAASGGNPDLVHHEDTGLLFPLDDSQSLAAAIIRVLKDPDLRARIAENARSNIVRTSERSTVVRHFANYYRSL